MKPLKHTPLLQKKVLLPLGIAGALAEAQSGFLSEGRAALKPLTASKVSEVATVPTEHVGWLYGRLARTDAQRAAEVFKREGWLAQ